MTLGSSEDIMAVSEIVKDGNSKCDKQQDYPVKATQAVSGLISGSTPVICGGLDKQRNVVGSCYEFGQYKKAVATLMVPRWGSASIVMGNKLWVTGGGKSIKNKEEWHTNRQPVRTTEYVVPHQKTQFGPELPLRLMQHCLAKTDAYAILVPGLREHGVVPSGTWVFSFKTQKWKKQKNDLKIRRFRHACGIIQDALYGNIIVVVTGGQILASKYTDSTELMDEKIGVWMDGPKLHGHIYDQTGITSEDGLSFFVVGGREHVMNFKSSKYVALTTINRLRCKGMQCEWYEMPQKLKVARAKPAAILIPDHLSPC